MESFRPQPISAIPYRGCRIAAVIGDIFRLRHCADSTLVAYCSATTVSCRVVWALWKNRQRTVTVQFPAGAISFKQALPLLLIPITTSLVYIIALTIGLTLPTLPIVYAITMPLGFFLLVFSLYKTIFQVNKHV